MTIVKASNTASPLHKNFYKATTNGLTSMTHLNRCVNKLAHMSLECIYSDVSKNIKYQVFFEQNVRKQLCVGKIPGIKITSDLWKSYDCISQEIFVHLKANHSLHFKDPATGAHTYAIKGAWRAVKQGLENNKSKQKLKSVSNIFI